MAIALGLALAGCSASFEIGRPKPVVIPPAAGATTIIEPDGAVIEERPAIDTVITGLQQAQTVRSLTRQLAR
jgi:hypothetical protein